jgi:hypothetical protein
MHPLGGADATVDERGTSINPGLGALVRTGSPIL